MEIIAENKKEIKNYLVNRCSGRHHPPHEMIFTEILFKHEFKDPKICEQFIAFVCQFYPNYNWQWVKYEDLQEMATTNAYMSFFTLEKKHRFKRKNISEEDYSRAKSFGDMSTEFCIRNLGYSLVGCGESKTIITSKDKVYDEFKDYLDDGYALFRPKKIYYTKEPNSILGHFQELPTLPFDDLYDYHGEYIEDNNRVFVKTISNNTTK